MLLTFANVEETATSPDGRMFRNRHKLSLINGSVVFHNDKKISFFLFLHCVPVETDFPNETHNLFLLFPPMLDSITSSDNNKDKKKYDTCNVHPSVKHVDIHVLQSQIEMKTHRATCDEFDTAEVQIPRNYRPSYAYARLLSVGEYAALYDRVSKVDILARMQRFKTNQWRNSALDIFNVLPFVQGYNRLHETEYHEIAGLYGQLTEQDKPTCMGIRELQQLMVNSEFKQATLVCSMLKRTIQVCCDFYRDVECGTCDDHLSYLDGNEYIASSFQMIDALRDIHCVNFDYLSPMMLSHSLFDWVSIFNGKQFQRLLQLQLQLTERSRIPFVLETRNPFVKECVKIDFDGMNEVHAFVPVHACKKSPSTEFFQHIHNCLATFLSDLKHRVQHEIWHSLDYDQNRCMIVLKICVRAKELKRWLVSRSISLKLRMHIF
jgi:hypothetical protein